MKNTLGVLATATVAALVVTSLVRAPEIGHSATPPALMRPHFGEGEYYPYQSDEFTQFVSDSYRESNGGQTSDFFNWIDKVCGQDTTFGPQGDLMRVKMAQQRAKLDAIRDRPTRAKTEMALAAALHHWVKTSIPIFSLDEGFEFYNVSKRGERQCLLQSVLIAALLQEADIDAGVVMVYRNADGHLSNNGHCVTLLKLSDGTDVLVDASDRQPFVRHQGLFVKDAMLKGYRYVEPVFKDNTPLILSYHPAEQTTPLGTRPIRPLDIHFLQSQFSYYRGERAHGGLLDASVTDQGLAREAHYLRASVHACPQNPLSVYMLGRVEWRRNHPDEARRQLQRASRLYRCSGWIPNGLRAAQRDAHLKQDG